MKKALVCLLAVVTVLTSSISVLAVPTNLKDVYNTATDTLENLNTNGGISPNAHKTIIIKKTHDIDGTEVSKNDNVVYVDQNVSAYSSALKIMFASADDTGYPEDTGLEPGYYEATMGTVSDASYERVNFVVGDYVVDPEDKLVILDAAEAYGQGTLAGTSTTTWYKKSFSKTISIDEYNSFKSLKLISEDGSKCIGAISLVNERYTSDNTHGYSWDKTKLSGEGDVTVALQIYAIPEAEKGFNLYFSTDAVVEQ